MNPLIRTGNFIDGQWSSSGPVYPVCNPANGAQIAEVQRAGAEETNLAIAAANRALPAWRKLTAKERSQRLKRWSELMLSNQKDLAHLLSLEQGKPLAEAMGEVVYAASFLEWFAEEAKRAYGDVIPSHKADARIIVTKEAIGVVAAITPWNFPLAMVTRKVGPALAAGCTMILKPSEETPLSAFALAVLAEQAGIPAGVFNIVSGDAVAIGGALQASSIVRKLSFTGSTRTGKLLMRQAADTLKKVSLELGGNAPFIVFDDADLDAAVTGAIASKYRNAGQTCVCANRIYVQDSVYDKFAAKLAEKVKGFKVGAGTEPGVMIGPLIDAQGLAKVEQHVADATAKGAKVTLGGKRHSRGGLFFEPTILTGVTQAMRVSREETFGPVAPLFRFKTDEEAIAMANDTEFGLAGYFYARDLGRIWRIAEAMETGMVCVNSGILSNEIAPFGGVKQSGIGREGSKYGIEEYLEVKYLLIGGIQ